MAFAAGGQYVYEPSGTNDRCQCFYRASTPYHRTYATRVKRGLYDRDHTERFCCFRAAAAGWTVLASGPLRLSPRITLAITLTVLSYLPQIISHVIPGPNRKFLVGFGLLIFLFLSLRFSGQGLLTLSARNHAWTLVRRTERLGDRYYRHLRVVWFFKRPPIVQRLDLRS